MNKLTKFLLWCVGIYCFALAAILQLIVAAALTAYLFKGLPGEINLMRVLFYEIGVAAFIQLGYVMAIRKPA